MVTIARCLLHAGGTVSYWTTAPGAPEVRNRCINHFADEGGFALILKLLQANPTEWIGAENARLLLQAVLETRTTLRDESLPQHLCACVMEPLAKLTEDELKASG
jgi:hypothetical protein